MKNNGACMRAVALISFLFVTIGSAAADQSAEEFMDSAWRAYRTMPSSSVVINARAYDQEGSVQSFSRFIVFWSQRGGIRINSPSCTWVHDGAKVYGSNACFPGCFQANIVGSNSGKALEAMDAMWPGLELPLDVRIRMANSWEEAFKWQIEKSGPDGVSSIETTTWKEGLPATLLTFTSSSGDYEEKIWFDATTGHMYGSLQRMREDGIDTFIGSQSLTEVTSNADKQIRFPVASREEFSNFTDLSNTFTSNFSIPSPKRIDTSSDSDIGSPSP